MIPPPPLRQYWDDGPVGDHRFRIVNKKRTGVGFPQGFQDPVKSRIQTWRTVRFIVCVACNEMHQASSKHLPGGFLRALSESAEQRLTRDLNQTAPLDPLLELFRNAAQFTVPLRMSHDRHEAARQQHS